MFSTYRPISEMQVKTLLHSIKMGRRLAPRRQGLRDHLPGLRQSQINLSPAHLTAGKAAYFSACEGFFYREPEPHISSNAFQFLT